MRPLYRFQQGLRALFGRLEPAELADAADVLGPDLYQLFRSMNRPFQRHCLDVYLRLKAHPEADAIVKQAALLHDVGKGRLGISARVAIVLLGATAPSLLRWLANGGGWRESFRADRCHPKIGAGLVASAGGCPEVVELVARHHQPANPDRRLSLLQAADDDN